MPRGAKGGAAHVGDGSGLLQNVQTHPARAGMALLCQATRRGTGTPGRGTRLSCTCCCGELRTRGLGGFPIWEDSQAHSELHSQLEKFGRPKYVIMGNNKPACNKGPIVTLDSPRRPALKRLGRGQGPGSSWIVQAVLVQGALYDTVIKCKAYFDRRGHERRNTGVILQLRLKN